MGHLRLQMRDLRGEPVDFLLRPENVADVDLVAVETLVGRGVTRQEGGGGRGGGGGGGDGQHRGAGGGRLGGALQLLDLFLESTLPSFQVTDLHLGDG